MGATTWTAHNATQQTGPKWRAAVDANLPILRPIAGAFAAHELATPNLTVPVDPGSLFIGGSAPVSQALQSVTGFVPTGANQRIDRIVIDLLTGAATRVAGTESASPSAPAIPAGKMPCAQVGPFTTSTAAITNSMITDERCLPLFNGGGTITGNVIITGSLTVQGAVTLSPANANVAISPTGTGTVTIAPATAGTINNMSIGATTRAAGNFTTLNANDNVTLCDAAGDTLTINAGTWTIGSNVAATRAAGALATGTTTLFNYATTHSGDAGGASIARNYEFSATSSGANAYSGNNLMRFVVTHGSSATTTNGTTGFFSTTLSASGNVTNVIGIQSTFTLSSSGGITGGVHFQATGSLTSTGAIATHVGFRASSTLGHASLVTNAIGFDAEDITTSGTLTVGHRSQLAAATGKWNFYASGTALNAFAGGVRIGSVVAPTATLDVTGTGAFSGVLSLASDPSTAWGLSFTPALFTITAAGTKTLAAGSGLILVHNNNTGEAGLFLTYASNVVKIAGAASIVSGAPGASQIGVDFSTDYRVRNGYATSQDIYIGTIKSRTAS